jgi:ketosteroid isomerase-like protein
MAEHPDVARIKDGYAAFAKGDFAALNDLFAEDLLWHATGRNQLVGEYRGREAVYEFFGKLMEVTEGSFHLDLHTVLVDGDHGIALAVATASRGGRSMEVNEAHVFHLHDGKVVDSGMPPPISTPPTS